MAWIHSGESIKGGYMLDYKDVPHVQINPVMLFITCVVGALCWLAVGYLFAFLVML